MKLALIDIRPSCRKSKKYVATFSDGARIHFGAKGMSNYTIHKDAARKARYLARHAVGENWDDPKSAGALSRFVLWNKRTLAASIADYKKRFGL